MIFRLVFDMPLDAAVAANRGNYHVVQWNARRPRQQRAIPVREASYDATTRSVSLALGSFGRRDPLRLWATGLVGINTPVANIVANL